jgi:hypothetical protein
MKTNLDHKSILIVLFIGLTIFFGFKWYFSISDNSLYKSNIKELKDENRSLKSKRDSISNENKILVSELDIILSRDSVLSSEILTLKLEIEDYKRKSLTTLIELNSIKGKIRESENRIKNFISSPVIKNEDEIINSLKKQLNL